MPLETLSETGAISGPDAADDDAHPFLLDIVIDEVAGSVRVYDPRIFQAGRRAFCRRLINAALRQRSVAKAEIHLDTASCRLDFDPDVATPPRRMAEVFSIAVRQAIDEPAEAGWSRWWPTASRWSAMTGYRADGGASLWETLESSPGRLRFRHPSLSGQRARLARLTESLAGLESVEDCRLSAWSRILTIDYRADSPIADRLPDLVERALEEWSADERKGRELSARADDEGGGPIEVATGARRVVNLALAGGAFAMTMVGLVVPGVPTVPFLLATSYYLARSSPRLDERLRRTAFFGPILVEWERQHGLSRSSKLKLMGLTVTIVLVTIALTPLSLVAVLVIVLIASMSLWGIARLPGLPGAPRHWNGIGQPVVAALPAP